MFFKINKKEFLDNINIVSRAVSINSPLPVLHNIKLTVKKDYVQLTASDSDISIQTSIYANNNSSLEIKDEGNILLDGKYLSDVIRKIDSETVEVEILDGYLTSIRGNAIKFELNGIKADNYPLIDFNKPEQQFTLKTETLKNIISQTCFATSDKETRPVLTGLNISCVGNKLTCVATDSYRLAEKIIELDKPHNFNITVPAKNLYDISKIMSFEGDVNIAISDKKILFEIGDVIVQTRLIDGLYPETSKLIPTEFAHELVVDSRDLLNALDRASFIKYDGICIIRMEITENEISISTKSNEIVSNEKIIPISYVGQPFSIAFKGNYVYDAVKALNAFQVKIKFSGSMKPFILKATDEENVLQLVLPINTYA